jgi:tetratricopeptide (TPR) repeat protein
MGIGLPALFTLGALWPALRRNERVVFVLLAALLVGLPITGAKVAPIAAPDAPGRAPFYGTLDLEHAPFTEERLAELRRRSAEQPDNGVLHFAVAWMAGRGGQYELARAEYAEAARLMPSEPRIPNNVGNLAEREGRLEEAEERYREAAVLSPGWAMPHYNLGQLYTRQFRYAEASEELARATSYDFELVREMQAEAQMHPGDAIPMAWGWLAPETQWDALWAHADAARGESVPPAWGAWMELRGTGMSVLAAVLGVAGLLLGLLVRHKLPVRACSNCEYAVCRRCASRRRDRAYCTECTAALREATTPEFSRLLLLRRRRGLSQVRQRAGVALALIFPGFGAALVDRIGVAWALLVIACAGVIGFFGSAPPYPYDRRVGPLAGLQLDPGALVPVACAAFLSLFLYLALREDGTRAEAASETAKRPAARLPRAA